MSSSASPPRPIFGSVGSRIRLVLGATGHDYVVLLHHDHGQDDGAWQTVDVSQGKGIPKNLLYKKAREFKAVFCVLGETCRSQAK